MDDRGRPALAAQVSSNTRAGLSGRELRWGRPLLLQLLVRGPLPSFLSLLPTSAPYSPVPSTTALRPLP